MNRIAHRVACTVLAVLFVSVRLVDIAQAEWMVTYLHPDGATYSAAVGVYEGQQVGHAAFATDTNLRRATLWSGTADSWVDLHPEGARASWALAVYDGQQVGHADFDLPGHPFARLWTGTAESWVSLHPAEARSSSAGAFHNGQQVGSTDLVPNWSRASLWSGTAESWVDLHPEGALISYAHDIYDGQQVGYAQFGVPRNSRNHASLWSGTAESWVDLHPEEAAFSTAYGVHEGIQVGIANIGDVNRASLWRGTAESWVDLHPNGAGLSIAHAIHDGLQVGIARFDGVAHASLWHGTAESWEDLSLHLTGSWGETSAYDIWSDATAIYVVGSGRNNTTRREEALLWTWAIARLPGDFNNNGVLDEADLNLLAIEINGNASDLLYDVNGDGKVNILDRGFWVGELRGTWFGDTNLDGVFNTADLVQVLALGKYEDPTAENVLWSEGDWNGDLRFNSADLVAALADGGYEAGPRPAASAVPEPASLCLLLTSLFALRRRRR